MNSITVNKKNCAEKYSVRRSIAQKHRYDKEVYLDQVAKIHHLEALEVTKVKEK
jgi:hypothetical protein